MDALDIDMEAVYAALTIEEAMAVIFGDEYVDLQGTEDWGY